MVYTSAVNMDSIRRGASSGFAGLYVVTSILGGTAIAPIDVAPASAAIIQQDALELPESLSEKFKVQTKAKTVAAPVAAPGFYRIPPFQSLPCDTCRTTIIESEFDRNRLVTLRRSDRAAQAGRSA